MDWLKIFGGPQALALLIPGICTQIGISLKNRDDNATGYDDAGGNVLIAIGPVVPAFLGGDTLTIRKVLKGVRDAIDGYLAQGG
jgi:hypothetical protein